MSDEKSKRPFKWKTLDEVKNDAAVEIQLFPKKRRSPLSNKSSVPTTPNEDDFFDEQVRRNFLFNSFHCFYSFKIIILVFDLGYY
jgi:hypothetical protein